MLRKSWWKDEERWWRTDKYVNLAIAMAATVAAGAAIAGVIAAAKALGSANSTARQAGNDEAKLIAATQAQSDGLAPLLEVGSLGSQRDHLTVAVPVGYPPVPKRADTLWVSRKRDRLIVPLVNDGRSVALTIGFPVLVTNCSKEPSQLAQQGLDQLQTHSTQAKRRLVQAQKRWGALFGLGQVGLKVVGAGSADQVDFVPQDAYLAGASEPTKHGTYRWDYVYKALAAPPTGSDVASARKLLLFYTDEAGDELRWICVNFVHPPERRVLGRPVQLIANNTTYDSMQPASPLGQG